jgi:hypothetical protein
MRILTIPMRTYSAGIEIQLPESPLSEADWGVFMAVLQAMKPALVEPDVVDAEIASPLLLTPDEAIEVAIVLRSEVDRGEFAVRRGTDLYALADRLDAHERNTGD